MPINDQGAKCICLKPGIHPAISIEHPYPPSRKMLTFPHLIESDLSKTMLIDIEGGLPLNLSIFAAWIPRKFIVSGHQAAIILPGRQFRFTIASGRCMVGDCRKPATYMHQPLWRDRCAGCPWERFIKVFGLVEIKFVWRPDHCGLTAPGPPGVLAFAFLDEAIATGANQFVFLICQNMTAM